MSEVKWIQITTDVFNNWKIKHIKAIPEIGHSLVCVWFELLCMAGSRNESGMIFLNNFVATDEIIAETFHEDIKLVKMALQVFENLEMITVINNNAIQISNWEEYQNEGGLAKIREYERTKKAKYRENKNSLIEDKKMSMDKSTDKSTPSSLSLSISSSYISNIEKIINYLNQKNNNNFKSSTKKTQTCITARLKEGFQLEDFYLVIDSKVRAWGNDAKMSQYLRPETLFGTKFESYLNTAQKEVWNTEDFNYDNGFNSLFNRYGQKGNVNESKREYLSMMQNTEDPKETSWWLYEGIKLYTEETELTYRKEFQSWLRDYSSTYVAKAKEKQGV